MVAIAIELGTTNTKVAVLKEKNVDIISVIPSIVRFTDTKILVGEEANYEVTF
jgi:molecular chaperone DnaK (HSP70)